MDTSKEYIQQCDCPKIQGQSVTPPYQNDYYARRKNYSIKYGYQLVASDIVDDEYVWLPTQDQIQGMLREHYAESFKDKRPKDRWFPEGNIGLGFVLNKFNKFTKENTTTIENCSSFEQIWLKLYIWETCEKVWSDNKWVK